MKIVEVNVVTNYIEDEVEISFGSDIDVEDDVADNYSNRDRITGFR